jgi:hypothetical protein
MSCTQGIKASQLWRACGLSIDETYSDDTVWPLCAVLHRIWVCLTSAGDTPSSFTLLHCYIYARLLHYEWRSIKHEWRSIKEVGLLQVRSQLGIGG